MASFFYKKEVTIIRVLVLTTTFPRWKGDVTPAFVYELSKRLQESGLEIVILAPHHYGAKKFEIMDCMKVYRFPYFYPTKYQRLVYGGGILPNLKISNLAKVQVPFLVFSELFYAFKIIRKEKIDIIHSHWIIPSGLIGVAIKKAFKKPHITTAHAGDVFTIRKSKILSNIGSVVFKKSNKITANSNFTKNVITSIDNTIKDNVEIIPMGVDTSRFNPKKKIDIRKTFSADHLILSVGRLVDKKGLKYLIMAMKDVVEEFPTAKLLIGGLGPEKENLECLSESLDMKDNVVFVGSIKKSDLPTYYASSDIFILPSIETKGGDTEGLGVVLLEAMASGIPVIGSNIGGITDIIKDNDNGFLTQPGNMKDISNKIINTLSDEKLRQKFSENGLKTIQERFSWDVVTEKFIKVYRN